MKLALNNAAARFLGLKTPRLPRKKKKGIKKRWEGVVYWRTFIKVKYKPDSPLMIHNGVSE